VDARRSDDASRVELAMKKQTHMEDCITFALLNDDRPFMVASQLWKDPRLAGKGSRSTFYRALWRLELIGGVIVYPVPGPRTDPRILIVCLRDRVRW